MFNSIHFSIVFQELQFPCLIFLTKDDVFLINYQFSYPDLKMISLFHLSLCIYFEVTDSLAYWGSGGSNWRTEIYTKAPISVLSSLCQHEASWMLHVEVEDTEIEHSTILELWGS